MITEVLFENSLLQPLRPQAASLPVRVPTIVSLLLLLSAQVLAACALLFATVVVTTSGQFLSFDYIGPMSGTLSNASRVARLVGSFT